MAETTISRNWLAKMVVFIAAFFGLGVWGLIDALVVYPGKGATFAEYMEFQYLQASDTSGELLRASVDDPAAELGALEPMKEQIAEELASLPAESMARRRKQTEQYKLAWLSALDMIGRNTAEHTAIPDPAARLDELRTEWATAKQPKPLSALDIPTQWLFVVIGVVGGGWMLMTVMKVSKTSYTFDEESRTLTMPGGRSFTPAEIDEVDKRKWDKFFATIKLSDGSLHKMDLLRYQPLEEWVLEMEKHSPNYEPPEDDEAGEGEADEAASDDAPAETPTGEGESERA